MDAEAPSSPGLTQPQVTRRAAAVRVGGVFVLTILLGALGTAVAFVGLDYPSTGIDDADIFLVYASHLAEGHGFVYNVGGEHVEGFSSLLWTVVIAPFFWFTSRPEPFLVGINLVFTSAALATLVLFVDRHLAPHLQSGRAKSAAWRLSFAGLLLIVWMLAAPGYISWTTLSLMETGLWSSLLAAATVCTLTICLREKPSYPLGVSLSLIIALLMLTRPEALLWGLVFAGFYFLSVLRQTGKPGTAIKHFLLPITAYGVTLAGLTMFRLAYFGYPLPNTYYAKVSPDRLYSLVGGIKYLLGFISSNGFVFVGLLAALGGLIRFGNGIRKERAGAFTRGIRIRPCLPARFDRPPGWCLDTCARRRRSLRGAPVLSAPVAAASCRRTVRVHLHLQSSRARTGGRSPEPLPLFPPRSVVPPVHVEQQPGVA